MLILALKAIGVLFWGSLKSIVIRNDREFNVSEFSGFKKHSKTPRRVARLMQNTEV